MKNQVDDKATNKISHSALNITCYLKMRPIKTNNKILFMVIATYQLATAFRSKNTPATPKGCIEPTEVTPYPLLKLLSQASIED